MEIKVCVFMNYMNIKQKHKLCAFQKLTQYCGYGKWVDINV